MSSAYDEDIVMRDVEDESDEEDEVVDELGTYYGFSIGYISNNTV